MTENKVKRYYSDYDDMNGNSAMTQSKNGHYVLFSDYELLKAKLDIALNTLNYIGWSPTRDSKEPIARRVFIQLSEGDK